MRAGRASGAQNPNAEKYRKIQDERNMDEDWHGVSIMRNDREVFWLSSPMDRGLNLNQPRGRWVGFEINFSANHDKSFVVKKT